MSRAFVLLLLGTVACDCTSVTVGKSGPSKKCKSQNPAQCSYDPCKGATCPGNPDAECRYDLQSGCKAVFYDQHGKEVECKELGGEDSCNDILCETDACITATCPSQMGVICRSTCNGCIPKFFDAFGNDITDKCKCTSGTSIQCDDNPCQGARCGNNLDVECRFDSCGGCEPYFYDESGNVVTC